MSDIAERVKKIVIEHLGVEEDKVVDSASFNNKLFFAQHIVLSKRTHQTDNHSPKCQAIHNMHIAQLVKNKNSMLCVE